MGDAPTQFITLHIIPKDGRFVVEMWRSGTLAWIEFVEETQAEAIDRGVTLLREATGRKD